MTARNLGLAIFPGLVDPAAFMIANAEEVFGISSEELRKSLVKETTKVDELLLKPPSASIPTPTPLPSSSTNTSSLQHSQPIPLPPGPVPSHPYRHKVSSTNSLLTPPLRTDSAEDGTDMGRSVTSTTSETPSVVVTEGSLSDGVDVDYVVVGEEDVGSPSSEGKEIGGVVQQTPVEVSNEGRPAAYQSPIAKAAAASIGIDQAGKTSQK
ncbi:hypothetical protein HK097_009453 [Rhizophlyctis rosea]|uniref:Uncharacterized protein n=1 Tax=Rhizophlyctis rosea TaxID=64517 RepID=A0AAD5S8X6_9FUNG|nr:hypothetical protein HK097_009453 [Rhizophlyctis rosea]